VGQFWTKYWTLIKKNCLKREGKLQMASMPLAPRPLPPPLKSWNREWKILYFGLNWSLERYTPTLRPTQMFESRYRHLLPCVWFFRGVFFSCLHHGLCQQNVYNTDEDEAIDLEQKWIVCSKAVHKRSIRMSRDEFSTIILCKNQYLIENIQ